MKGHPPAVVRLSVASSRVVSRLVGGLWSVHSGFWLGVLSDRAVEQSTELFYASNPRFLDAEHNTAGLYPWEQELVAAYCPAGGRILVPAAGGGREVIALAEMGYEAVGYDPSPELVSLGNELISDMHSDAVLLLSHGSEQPADLGPPFDSVLFGWGGVSHIRGSATRVATLERVLDVLKPGGSLIVSFLSREPESRRFTLTYRVATWIRRLVRSGVTVELGDTVDGSFDHYFTFDEVTAESAAAGFIEVEQVSSPFSVLVCRKP